MALAASLLAFEQARAGQSEWQELGGGKVRLIAEKDPYDGTLEGVIEVRLEEGWKTYWLSPGDSGIPPEFDFSRSRGSLVETITFPVPSHLKAGESDFYGYRNEVRFHFSGLSDGTDSDLNLDLLIGVCEEICIPATASLSIGSDALNTSDPMAGMRLEMARSSLPASASEGLKAVSAWYNNGRAGLVIDGTSIRDGDMVVVMRVPGVWTSDPLDALKQPDGTYQVATGLPAGQKELLGLSGQWHYSILIRDPASGTIERAVEGAIATTD